MGLVKTLVLQKRSVSYAECGGKQMLIPCGEDSLGIAGEGWAVPVKDNGVFRGYTFQSAASAPTYDSFPVTKIYDKQTGENYWVVGTEAEVLALCADGTQPATVIPVVVPEITLCVDETEDNTSVEFTLEALVAPNDAYKLNLAADGVLLEDNEVEAGAGFADAAAIVVFLIANHAALGTWTSPAARRIKLVSTIDQTVGLVAVPFNNP